MYIDSFFVIHARLNLLLCDLQRAAAEALDQ